MCVCHARMHACMPACMHACKHTYLHTCIHTCMHAYRCDPTRWVMATPQPNTFNTDFLNPPTPAVATVAAGAYHNVMINDDGKLEVWGWNGYLCVCIYIYTHTHTHVYI